MFLVVGENLLNIMGVDVRSFAVAGSIVIFILGLELVLGIEFFKADTSASGSTVVPIAFPMIAGSGTLTTIISLKATYSSAVIFTSILVNLGIVYIVLLSLGRIAKILGPAGLLGRDFIDHLHFHALFDGADGVDDLGSLGADFGVLQGDLSRLFSRAR